MARQQFNPSTPTPTNEHIYSALLRTMLSGTITVKKLHDAHKKNQKVKIEYDDE